MSDSTLRVLASHSVPLPLSLSLLQLCRVFKADITAALQAAASQPLKATAVPPSAHPPPLPPPLSAPPRLPPADSSGAASSAGAAETQRHSDAQAQAQAVREAQRRACVALESSLLPALQLLPANPPVCLQLWQLMSLIPYQVGGRGG